MSTNTNLEDRKTFLLIRKITTVVLALAWMAVIYAFSAQPAGQSSQASGSVAYKIAEWQNGFFRLDKTEAELSAQAESMQLFIRKTAHMGEYALLAILLCLHFSCYAWNGRRLALSSLAFTAGYAATDEFHQLFVPGRAGRLSDVCIDSLGGALGIAFFLLILRLGRKR